MNTFLFRKFTPLAALLGLGITACQPDLEDDFKPNKGSADFSRYIAVGNSLTAGYGDNGLYLEGQLNSYPNLLAQQFRTAGGGEFVQPLFTEAQSNGSGYLRLTGFTAAGTPITASVPGNAGRLTPGSAPYTKVTTPINNLGVPGIRLADIHTAGYGNVQTTPLNAATFNPFFERITPDGSNQTYFQRVKAEAATATFFSSWLGNNDVLGYATTGGVGGIITRTDSFTLKNNRIINVLTANGAKGVVATLPDVTNIPFFTTVRVADIRARFKAANSALDVYIQTTGTAGAQVVRLATDADLLTLPSSAVIGTTTTGSPFPVGAGVGTGVGQSNPVPNQFVLDATEQTAVRTATTAFNNAIVTKANEKNLAIFDSNAFFARVATSGITTNGVTNTAAFISGNLFSLDGVHPTPRGYAVIANEMIRAINSKYNASVPTVNPNDYRGVRFPQ
ncbi:SGNH/GDSL hydrolase family protein [Hymenobacter sp. 5516J-16]|uniref:SGNH/GDSL hydrolase family protein n=1 Tax=Hymenobacter sublimis TaxID=2933777 RepID=A0ABY4JBJ3_9BACT|nr:MULTISPECIES: SGNH/GDSL hydrolase family protein [Hymenobacter]UOQ75653.1 SGNH/GDSL hydrolase family protein [Hymenobacter sp. 5516J-16]UPL49317.1 SGNH/GDSL hydrolase family protein [Hymenobacter sublimis]